MKPTPRMKVVKAWCIVSNDGLMYDANGNSMALAVYADKEKISAERKKVMIDEDRIVPCEISYPISSKRKV